MKYVLYDLEALGTRGEDDFMEIVEVAAIKVEVSKDTARIVDTYHSFIKPIFHSKITKKLHKLLSLKESDLASAPNYDKVLPEFLKWAGKDVLFVSWGHDEDMIYENNSKHYLFDCASMDCLDLQFIYDMHNGKKLRTGLKTALEEQHFDFEGQQHTALDDARNMFPLFKKYFRDICSYLSTSFQGGYTSNVAYA